ncbi:peptide chain release factor N(5)-glutamine methyltransferase [Mangrovitalea sediminis]|uniref:peptide chain release factor N(5)-glutamine methyltransferase n=1 Tax=Mangrovitalea sediminis TaxID=1982043 RepID=UPI000BE51447|nr:peptide chain release factor N(5)-glutamine methyltransferase [Mangrovitalea sediminis]
MTDIPTPQTVAEALAWASDRIDSESARLDAVLLLGRVMGQSRTWLYTWPDAALSETQQAAFQTLVERRAVGEPVAYLLGEREFWSLPLSVNASTLIPRPDTECLVETILVLALPEQARVLDLGTGTGAIALALAFERPEWQVWGVDRSPEAVALAKANSVKLALEHVHFAESDWFSALEPQHFHMIVANPPYIDAQDPHLEQGDVRFEPRSALVAGDAGLADLRDIVHAAPDWLMPGGWIVLEHGWQQAEAVQALLEARGFRRVASQRDYGGNLRLTLAQWESP